MNSSSDLTTFQQTYPGATKDDMTRFTAKRQKMFKGTIAVCVIYGTFALLLLLLTIFYQPARSLITENMMTFVISFVAGMIFIIVILVIQVTTFKPTIFKNSFFDPDICPDYWKLVPSTDADLNKLNATVGSSAAYLMKYKCVPDSNVFDPNTKFKGDAATNVYGYTKDTGTSAVGQYYVTVPAAPTGIISKQYVNSVATSNVSRNMSGDTNNTNKLYCDVVFPNYLASLEATDSNISKSNLAPNSYRCAYAKMCGVPWTNACPVNETKTSINF